MTSNIIVIIIIIIIHANIVIIWVGYLLNKSKVIPSAAMAWWSLSGQNDAKENTPVGYYSL